MSSNRSSGLAWWSAATILVSAFLLFQVQPVISKKILPWFGGSPAVWTTCVLFFQLVLLGGYAYSHWLIRYVRPGRQGLIHATLLVLALGTLLIGPRDFWKPVDGNYPALRILVLLLAVVGASYFLLSTTGPLVQAWFSQLYPGRSPYRLYALSNVGSLAALLTYPFLIETTLAVDHQWMIWALGFLIFAGLVGFMALTMWREAKTIPLPFATVTPAGASPPVVATAEGLVAKPPRPVPSSRSRSRRAPNCRAERLAAPRLALPRRAGLDGSLGHYEPPLPGHRRRPLHVGHSAQPVPALVHHLLRQRAVVRAKAVRHGCRPRCALARWTAQLWQGR